MVPSRFVPLYDMYNMAAEVGNPLKNYVQLLYRCRLTAARSSPVLSQPIT